MQETNFNSDVCITRHTILVYWVLRVYHEV